MHKLTLFTQLRLILPKFYSCLLFILYVACLFTALDVIVLHFRSA
jgi:hypothetical protein